MGAFDPTPIDYRRLSGRARSADRFFTWPETQQLFLGPDHILLVSSVSFVEEYKRFYFRDIQAITVLRRQPDWVTMIATGVTACACAILAASVASGGWAVILWVITAMCAIAIVHWLWNGPSCRCFLRTAVQQKELFPMKRWRAAQLILRLVVPLVEEAQGKLNPGERTEPVGAFGDPSGAGRAPSVVSYGSLGPVAAVQPVKAHRSRAPLYFFASVVALAALAGLYVSIPSRGLAVGALLGSPVVVVGGIIAVAGRRGTDLDSVVAILSRIGLGLGLYILGRAYISLIYAGVGDPEAATNPWVQMEKVISTPPIPGSFRFYEGLAECLLGLAVGLLGMILFARFKSRQARAGAGGVSIPERA
jgi:hypothetical protein